MSKIMSFLSLFVAVSGLNVCAQTKADTNQVEVNIEGLSCPFCAYGLEKKVKDIDGAKDIKIDIKKGLLTFSLTGRKDVDEEKIKKVVKDAGFTPKEIKFHNEASDKKEDKKTGD